MKLSVILETVQDQIETISQRLSIEPDDVIQIARRASNKHWKFVLNQWFQNKIRLPEDSRRVKEALTSFEKYRKSLLLKDINQYKTISKIEKAVNAATGKVEEQFTTNLNRPGVEIVNKFHLQYDHFTTVKVSDAEALKDLGEGTKWCTRRSYPDCAAENYLQEYGYIFIIFYNNKPFIQFTPDYTQIMDIYDDPIDVSKSDLDVGLIESLRPINPTPRQAVNFSDIVLQGRWPEAEPIIMQDPESAYKYAGDFIGRWPEAEPFIMRDPIVAYHYALYRIEGRWPEAEPFIMQHPSAAQSYAADILKSRWPAAEPIILQSPFQSYLYARNVIQGRWPEAELLFSASNFFRSQR
jgi:hypothetical protein